MYVFSSTKLYSFKYFMFQESYMRKIMATVGIVAVLALASYTYYTLKAAKYLYSGPTTISVSGEGEVLATPDVATFSFTVESKENDAVTAQNKSAETMSAILAYLKEAGVEEKDVKTEYFNLSPRYDYPQVVCTAWGCPPAGEPKLIGYQVSQNVSVKVRDTAKAGEILSQIGSKGAMNVSGLSFTIDDTNVFKAEAREKAIADAKVKAEALAENLGVDIVRMNGFWEEEMGSSMYYGKGGMDMAMSGSSMSPRAAELPMGENIITARVNISYEIR